jgi:hypothetical protein
MAAACTWPIGPGQAARTPAVIRVMLSSGRAVRVAVITVPIRRTFFAVADAEEEGEPVEVGAERAGVAGRVADEGGEAVG